MKRSISNKVIYYFIGIILLIGIWVLLSYLIGEGTMVFPNPIDTFKEMFNILSKKYIYQCIGSSILRMVIGFLISIVLALIFGLLAGNSEKIKTILIPLMTTLKSIPTASLVFLFLVLVGAKNAPILLVILISFPILYESVVGGIENIDKDVIDATKVDGGNLFRRVLRVQLPLSISYILVGISSSFGLSFKIEIMAEILTGDTRSGLGSAILASQKNDPTNMVPIFAYSLIAIIFILIISLISGLIKKRVNSKI